MKSATHHFNLSLHSLFMFLPLSAHLGGLGVYATVLMSLRRRVTRNRRRILMALMMRTFCEVIRPTTASGHICHRKVMWDIYAKNRSGGDENRCKLGRWNGERTFTSSPPPPPTHPVYTSTEHLESLGGLHSQASSRHTNRHFFDTTKCILC